MYFNHQFCIPSFADGRDLLEDVLNTKWDPSYGIAEIIGRIPAFLTDFIQKLSEGTVIFYGNYYLGEKYDMNVIQTLPVYFKKIKQKTIVDNKEKIVER